MTKLDHDAETGVFRRFSGLDSRGAEIIDPVPHSPPVKLTTAAANEVERVRSLVRQELSRGAAARGEETFEDADDFDVGDDFDPASPYEEEFEPPVVASADQDAKAAAAVPPPKEPAPPAEPPAEDPPTV